MRRDYLIALFIPSFMKRFFVTHTENGFCHYLRHRFPTMLRLSQLPELLSTEPKKHYRLHWFKPSKIIPRLKCINAAIRTCKATIKDIC